MTLTPSEQERRITAWHEAGHALMAIAVGFVVDKVTIVPTALDDGTATEGHVLRQPGPVPTEDDCAPGAPWLEAWLRVVLAGDRAGRVAGGADTSLGGRSSDYAKAEALMSAVYGTSDVESQLDRLCREVDELFATDRWLEDLEAVAQVLLQSEEMSGDTLRDLVTDGKCGCLNPEDADIRCNNRPHSSHRHLWVPPREDREAGRRLVSWDGYTTKEPRRRGTARWQRVVRLTHPGWLPEPQSDASLEEIQEYFAMQSDGRLARLPKAEQTRIRRRVMRTIVKRTRKDTSVGLPPLSGTSTWSRETAITQHSADCAGILEIAADGSAWCSECAFETDKMTADRPSRSKLAYFVVELQQIEVNDEIDDLALVVSQRLVEGFRSSESAATYVRLARQRNPQWQLRVERISLN